MCVTRLAKMVRHLRGADGYLQLQMPDHALEELDRIADPGPLEAPLQVLRGEALRTKQDYDAAIPALQRAAELIPPPFNRAAWLSLADCFRRRGQEHLAEVVEMFANLPAEMPAEAMPVTLQIDQSLPGAQSVPVNSPQWV
ncbi:MAG: tetratricopeptide repeat protein [Planctomycetaceae bacterium]